MTHEHKPCPMPDITDADRELARKFRDPNPQCHQCPTINDCYDCVAGHIARARAPERARAAAVRQALKTLAMKCESLAHRVVRPGSVEGRDLAAAAQEARAVLDGKE